MVKEWTNELLEKLILMYKERPCLWKLNHEGYTNKNLKQKAYDEIVDAFKDTFPQVDHQTIKTKIQNMRGSYRKELKKIDAAERSGAGTDEQYTPVLWYFNLLSFTRDQERPVISLSNFGESQNSPNMSELENTFQEQGVLQDNENEENEERHQEKQTGGVFVGTLFLICLCRAGRPRYIAIPVDDAKWLETAPEAVQAAVDPEDRPLFRIPRGSYKEPPISRAIYVDPPPPSAINQYEKDVTMENDNDSDGDEAARVERQSGGGHHEYVDYGAHTGHHGAFGWYADFPVHKHSR